MVKGVGIILFPVKFLRTKYDWVDAAAAHITSPYLFSPVFFGLFKRIAMLSLIFVKSGCSYVTEKRFIRQCLLCKARDGAQCEPIRQVLEYVNGHLLKKSTLFELLALILFLALPLCTTNC